MWKLGRCIGVYVRYYFFKLIGRPKSLEYLKGSSDDGANNLSHGCINIMIGFPIVLLIIIGIVYLYFTFFD